jgi:hypothetical protein
MHRHSVRQQSASTEHIVVNGFKPAVSMLKPVRPFLRFGSVDHFESSRSVACFSADQMERKQEAEFDSSDFQNG